MAKSADAFRTISEVAAWLEVPAHVLRFWESKFTQVKPVKRAGGRRYYRPSDMQLLAGIKMLLHDEGMTIKGVQKTLREQGVRHVCALAPPFDVEDGGEVLNFSRRSATRTADSATPSAAAEAGAAVKDDQPEPLEEPQSEPERAFSLEPETDAEPEPDAAAEAEPSPDLQPTSTDEITAEAEPANRSEAPDPAASQTAPARPALPDLPPDPPDDIAADPGPLSRIAALPRPLPAALARELAAIAESLRARSPGTR